MRRGVPHTAKPSDQMPEEAPAEQVPDDVPSALDGAARESARRQAKRASRQPNGRHDRARKGLPDDYAKHGAGR
jgi:hypothetical protein